MEAKLIKVENTFYLKQGGTILGTSSSPNLSASIRYSLSLKNCQAIELGYDLDELAKEYVKISSLEFDAFESGFQKALEILGDKKFSEDDVIKCMKNAYGIKYFSEHKMIENLKSLQQTEWDVEIVEESIGRVKLGVGSKTEQMMPKLDADGCLILRRI